jgi:hypothetical protein
VPRPTQGSCRTLRLRGSHPLWRTFPDPSASSCKTTGLLRFRSPLLAESLLMSVPPGTEMFQFPGFASRPYVFRPGYPLRGGLPHSDIRGSTSARLSPRLFAACHVLHRLLAPRHPPDALLVLTIPSATRPHAGPNRAPRARPDSRTHTPGPQQRPSPRARAHTQPTPDSPVKEQHNRPRLRTTGDRSTGRVFWKATPHEEGSHRSTPQPPNRRAAAHREWRAEPVIHRRRYFAGSPQAGCFHIQPRRLSLKGGDPAAGSPTATLLRLHPSR